MKNTIETQRLLLRGWTISDVDDMVEGLSEFDVTKNLIIPFPYTKEDAIAYISKHLKNTKDSFAFAIVLKEINKVIGGTSLDYDLETGFYKGGIWLNKKYIGKGYGTEAFRARAEFAFNELGASCLQNGFFEWNEKSFNMQKKLGYKIIGNRYTYCPALNKEVLEVLTLLKKEDLK